MKFTIIAFVIGSCHHLYNNYYYTDDAGKIMLHIENKTTYSKIVSFISEVGAFCFAGAVVDQLFNSLDDHISGFNIACKELTPVLDKLSDEIKQLQGFKVNLHVERIPVSNETINKSE